MKIEILGMGCQNCKKLYDNAKSAMDELHIQADLIKVEDINKITEYAVMMTPAIVVNGTVKSFGRVPSVEEIKGWLV